MEDILPDLYAETTIKLKREVEMGPFKYPVDDALDNRKAAFECMYTVLQSCIDRVNIFQFLDHIEIGLKDVPDIKMLTYLMVLRLVHINPNAIMLSKSHGLLFIVHHIYLSCSETIGDNTLLQSSQYSKSSLQSFK